MVITVSRLSNILKGIAVLSLFVSVLSGLVALAQSADDHFQSAYQLRFNGDTKDAVDELRKGLELNPSSINAHLQLAELLAEESGDIDASISELVTALGIDPDCKACQMQLDRYLEIRNSGSEEQIARGNRYYSVGDLKRAIAAYRIAANLDSSNATAYNSLAWALYRLGALDEAMSEVLKALSLKPDDPEYINTLGSIELDKGAVSQAAVHFRKAIASAKTTPSPADLYGLAVIALDRGAKGEATRYLKSALAIDPLYADLVYLRDRIGMSPKTLSNHYRLLGLLPEKNSGSK